MGLIDGICSVFSGAVSAVKSVVSAAATFVSKLDPVLDKLGMGVGQVLGIIGKIVKIAAIILNIATEDQKVEDLGEKVIQAEEQDGITLESCNNDFKEYKKRIDEFEIDPKKAEGRDPTKQLSAGIVYLSEGIKQKDPSLNLDSFVNLVLSNNEYFTEDRVKSYVDTVVNNGYSFDRITNYVKGKVPIIEGRETEALIFNAEQKLNPQMSREDIKSQLADLKIGKFE